MIRIPLNPARRIWLTCACLALMVASCAAFAPAASAKARTAAQAKALISKRFAFIWNDGYQNNLSMGPQIGSLSTGQVQQDLYDPSTGKIRAAFARGLFGYVNASGSVEPIDASLVASRHGFSPAGTSYQAIFPKAFSTGVTWAWSKSMADAVSLVPLAASTRSRGVVVGPNGEQVLYPDAWPGVDVVEAVQGAGIQDEFVVRSQSVPKTFTFKVKHPRHARTQLDQDGNVVITRKNGTQIAAFHAPVGVDAKRHGVRAWYTVKHGTVLYDVVTLHYSTDPDLANLLPPAAYPLVIDPDVTNMCPDNPHGNTNHVICPVSLSTSDPVGEFDGMTSTDTGALSNTTFEQDVSYVSKFAPSADNGNSHVNVGDEAMWVFPAPPGDATWDKISADLTGYVDEYDTYKLTSNGVTLSSKVEGTNCATVTHTLSTTWTGTDTDPDYFSDACLSVTPTNGYGMAAQIDHTGNNHATVPAQFYRGVLKNTTVEYYDNAPPKVYIQPENTPTVYSDLATAYNTITASIHTVDAESGCASQQLSFDGQTIHFPDCGNDSYAFSTSDVPAGTVSIHGFGYDNVGNEGENLDNTVSVVDPFAALATSRLTGSVHFTYRIADSLAGVAATPVLVGVDNPSAYIPLDAPHAAPGSYTTPDFDTMTIQNGHYDLDLIANGQVIESVPVGVANPHPVLGQDDASGNIATTDVGNDFVVSDTSGNLTTEATDLDTRGFGVEFLVERAYQSEVNLSGGFGPGWTASFERRIQPTPDGFLLYMDPSGTEYYFPPNPSNSNVWDAPYGIDATITKDPQGTYTVHFLDGSEEIYATQGGELLETVTPQGNTITMNYTDGRVTSMCDAPSSGLCVTIGYTGSRIASISTQMNETTHYGYDSSGRLTDVYDPAGGHVHYSYDGTSARIASVAVDGQGTLAHIAYAQSSGESWYHVTSVVQPGDATSDPTTFSYAGTLPSDVTTHIADEGDTEQTITNFYGDLTTDTFDGVPTSETFDARGHVTSDTDEDSNTTHYQYDAAGDLTSELDPGASAPTTYSNFVDGEPENTSDPTGGTTHDAYDASGNLTSETNSQSGTTSYTYDPAGNPLTIAPPAGTGGVTHNTYDQHGFPQRTVDGLNDETDYTYDADGRLVSETHPDHGTYTYAYDGLGRQTGVTDPANNTQTTVYDAAGNETSSTSPGGHTTTYTYDAKGNQLTQTNPLGQTTTTTYDSKGNPLTVTDPLGHTTTYGYSDRGAELTETDPLGRTTTYTVDAAGNTLTETDPEGNTTSYDLDAAYDQTGVTGPDGGHTSSTYDDLGEVTSQTDALGNVTHSEYDHDGNLVKAIDALGNTTEDAYDTNDQLTSSTTPMGLETDYTYDGDGNQASVTTPDGSSSSKTYDYRGNVVTSTDANGQTTTYGYDQLGRLTSVTDPLGHVTHYAYDADGNLISTTLPNGETTTDQYDANGEKTSETDGDGQTTTYTYDAGGNLTEVTPASGDSTTYSYDAANEQTAETIGDQTTRTTYTDDGQPATVTSANGDTTSYTYTSMGQVATVTNQNGDTTQYSYNQDGQETAEVDPTGLETDYTYDPDGHETSVSSPVSGTTTFSYNADGDLTGTTNSNGQATSYQYDDEGRVIEIDEPDCTITEAWDPVGNLTSVHDCSGITSYTYDDADRVVGMTTPDATKIAYTYDDAGLVASITAAGVKASYSYDAAGNQTKLSGPDGTVSYTWTPAQQLQTVTYPGGLTSTHSYTATGDVASIVDSDHESLAYTYDEIHRIKTATLDGVIDTYGYNAAGELVDWKQSTCIDTTYTYDDAGDLLTIVRKLTCAPRILIPAHYLSEFDGFFHHGVSLSDHDADLLLSELVTSTCRFDASWDPRHFRGYDEYIAAYLYQHPITIRSYTYNTLHQLTSMTDLASHHTTTYTYDQAGNQVTQDNLARTYNAEGELTSVQLADGGSVSYTYDYRHLLVKRTETHPHTPTQTTTYAYNHQNQLAAESTIKQAISHFGRPLPGTIGQKQTTTYTYTHTGQLATITLPTNTPGLQGYGIPGFNNRFGHRGHSTPSGITFYYHQNTHGDTTRLTDTSGHTQAAYTYTPYGETLTQGNQTLLQHNPFTYNGTDGIQWDPTTGNYWMHARWYNPQQTRFLTTDPQPVNATTGTDEPYTYAGNDPINISDPSGRCWEIGDGKPYSSVLVWIPTGPCITPPTPTKVTTDECQSWFGRGQFSNGYDCYFDGSIASTSDATNAILFVSGVGDVYEGAVITSEMIRLAGSEEAAKKGIPLIGKKIVSKETANAGADATYEVSVHAAMRIARTDRALTYEQIEKTVAKGTKVNWLSNGRLSRAFVKREGRYGTVVFVKNGMIESTYKQRWTRVLQHIAKV